MVIILSMCLFLLYWAGLYGSKDAESLKAGARRLMIKAAELARQSQGADQASVVLRIEAP
jgi:hypothetical protein